MLELQRNVIFGQFIDTGSPIHRMDARIKLVITFVFIVASFLINDFLGFAVVLPLLVLIQAVSRVPIGYVPTREPALFGVPGLRPLFSGPLLPRRRAESSYLGTGDSLDSTEGPTQRGYWPARHLPLLRDDHAHADHLARGSDERFGAYLRSAAEDTGSGQRASAGVRHSYKVRPDIYRGGRASRPRPDGPRGTLRRGRSSSSRPPHRSPAGPDLHQRLCPRRPPGDRHEHPKLPWRPWPHQATPAARYPHRLAGAATGGGLDAAAWHSRWLLCKTSVERRIHKMRTGSLWQCSIPPQRIVLQVELVDLDNQSLGRVLLLRQAV